MTLHQQLSVMGVLLVALLTGAGLAAPPDTATQALEQTQLAFRAVHAKVAPAIVSISARGVEAANPLGGQRPFRSSGSGVIIRKEGIVLTNSHVVANATRLTVKMPDSDKELPAEVVQTDPRTDLAVVRITEKGDYPVATLGDAAAVKEGDWAVAFGTMTVGIISATNRRIPSPTDEFTYRDLLQTDAAINPGNSGGALVNIRGELIGINFMIFSPNDSPGSVGIGFAIPINEFTKQVIEALVSGKAFERGQLGVRIADLDPTLREEYGVKEGGVFVHEVAPGGAAEKAGIQAEDIIVAVNGTKITDTNQFVRLIEATKPGSKVTVTVMRGKKTQDVTVTMGAVDAPRANSYATKLGLTVTGITPEMAAQLRLPVTRGVVITNVAAGSIAEESDLRRGDIILRVGTAFEGVEVTTPEEFWAAVDKGMNARGSLGVVLQIRRGARIFIRTLEKPTE